MTLPRVFSSPADRSLIHNSPPNPISDGRHSCAFKAVEIGVNLLCSRVLFPENSFVGGSLRHSPCNHYTDLDLYGFYLLLQHPRSNFDRPLNIETGEFEDGRPFDWAPPIQVSAPTIRVMMYYDHLILWIQNVFQHVDCQVLYDCRRMVVDA